MISMGPLKQDTVPPVVLDFDNSGEETQSDDCSPEVSEQIERSK